MDPHRKAEFLFMINFHSLPLASLFPPRLRRNLWAVMESVKVNFFPSLKFPQEIKVGSSDRFKIVSL